MYKALKNVIFTISTGKRRISEPSTVMFEKNTNRKHKKGHHTPTRVPRYISLRCSSFSFQIATEKNHGIFPFQRHLESHHTKGTMTWASCYNTIFSSVHTETNIHIYHIYICIDYIHINTTASINLYTSTSTLHQSVIHQHYNSK